MVAIARATKRSAAAPGFGQRWKDFDLYMLVTTVVLMGFGAVAIWSADDGVLRLGNLGVRQGIYGALGVVLMMVVAMVDYRFLASFAWPIYAAGLALLALVLVPGIGTDLGTTSFRWFNLGFTTVQPSEFVKLATLIALASFVASRGPAMLEVGNFLISLLIVAAPMALVFRQPDLGTSLVYGVIWVSVMVVARTRKLYFAVLAALALPAVLLAWEFVLRDYQRARWLIFLNPMADPTGEGFNIIQAEISIGAGGWFGSGLLGGSQSQLDLLSVRESDFIFAHASGMYGFVGMLALLASYGILLWRCLLVVETARDGFGQCLALGVSGILFFQAFVNIGMNVGLLPVTGITLPFVSSGLSSLWTFLIAEGLLQSILMRHRKLAFQPT
jgi:rod shape determining protein RodA